MKKTDMFKTSLFIVSLIVSFSLISMAFECRVYAGPYSDAEKFGKKKNEQSPKEKLIDDLKNALSDNSKIIELLTDGKSGLAPEDILAAARSAFGGDSEKFNWIRAAYQGAKGRISEFKEKLGEGKTLSVPADATGIRMQKIKSGLKPADEKKPVKDEKPVVQEKASAEITRGGTIDSRTAEQKVADIKSQALKKYNDLFRQGLSDYSEIPEEIRSSYDRVIGQIEVSQSQPVDTGSQQVIQPTGVGPANRNGMVENTQAAGAAGIGTGTSVQPSGTPRDPFAGTRSGGFLMQTMEGGK